MRNTLKTVKTKMRKAKKSQCKTGYFQRPTTSDFLLQVHVIASADAIQIQVKFHSKEISKPKSNQILIQILLYVN